MIEGYPHFRKPPDDGLGLPVKPHIFIGPSPAVSHIPFLRSPDFLVSSATILARVPLLVEHSDPLSAGHTCLYYICITCMHALHYLALR